MKQLLAFKNIAYGTPEAGKAAADTLNNPGHLADGAMGIYVKRADGRGLQLVTDTVTAIVGAYAIEGGFQDEPEFYIARGLAEAGAAIVTEPIKRGNAKLRMGAAVAGTPKVVTLSNLIPIAGKGGDVAWLYITKEEANVLREDVRSYGYRQATDAEAPEVGAATIVDAINADTNSPVTAATAGAGAATTITLTAKTADTNFTVDGDNLYYGLTKTTTTPQDIPVQDYASMKALEDLCAAYQGAKSESTLYWRQTAEYSQLTGGSSYDVWNLTYTWTNVRVATPDVVAARKKRVYLALPDGTTTLKTAMKAILAKALNIADEPVETGDDDE